MDLAGKVMLVTGIGRQMAQARLDRIRAMGVGEMARPVLCLGSDAAREVTGQGFAVRKNEMSQARPIRAGFFPLDRSADISSRDRV